jgi:hypothetical protein
MPGGGVEDKIRDYLNSGTGISGLDDLEDKLKKAYA